MEPETDYTQIQFLTKWSEYHPVLNRYLQILYASKHFTALLNRIEELINSCYKPPTSSWAPQPQTVNELAAKIIEMIDTELTGIIFMQKYGVIRAIIKQCNYVEFFRMFYNIGTHFAVITETTGGMIANETDDEMRVLIVSHFARINVIYRPLAKKYVKDNPSMKIIVDGVLRRIRLRGIIKKFFLVDVHSDINGLYLLSQHPYINWDHITTANVEWNPRGVSRNPNVTWDIVEKNPGYPWSFYDLSFNPNISREIAIRNISKDWHTLWILQRLAEPTDIPDTTETVENSDTEDLADMMDITDIADNTENTENWEKWEDIDLDDYPSITHAPKVTRNFQKSEKTYGNQKCITWDDYYNEDDYLNDFRYAD